ncbi:MAG: hypothetical protein ACREN3_15045, partial [Gemmatimonadaceae bacterium]
ERRGEERRNQFARAFVPPDAPAPPAPLALSLGELLAAVDRLLRAVRRPDMHDVVSRPLDVPAAVALIRELLQIRARILWTEIVTRDAEPSFVLSTLLGLLELAKVGELRVHQPTPFANVEIERDAAGEAA